MSEEKIFRQWSSPWLPIHVIFISTHTFSIWGKFYGVFDSSELEFYDEMSNYASPSLPIYKKSLHLRFDLYLNTEYLFYVGFIGFFGSLISNLKSKKYFLHLRGYLYIKIHCITVFTYIFRSQKSFFTTKKLKKSHQSQKTPCHVMKTCMTVKKIRISIISTGISIETEFLNPQISTEPWQLKKKSKRDQSKLNFGHILALKSRN